MKQTDRQTDRQVSVWSVQTYTVIIVSLISVVTDALITASRVETLLCACVKSGDVAVALVDVDAGARVRRQCVSGRACADERAGCVATCELAGRRRHRLTLVDVDALTLSLVDVDLVAGVTETPVRAESVDATTVLTRVRHHSTLVQIYTSINNHS